MMRNVLFPSFSFLSSLCPQEEMMVVMEKEKRCARNNNTDICYEFSSPLLNRISELEDTLNSKSMAEKALEQQKQACDCHVISMS